MVAGRHQHIKMQHSHSSMHVQWAGMHAGCMQPASWLANYCTHACSAPFLLVKAEDVTHRTSLSHCCSSSYTGSSPNKAVMEGSRNAHYSTSPTRRANLPSVHIQLSACMHACACVPAPTRKRCPPHGSAHVRMLPEACCAISAAPKENRDEC